MALSRDTSRNYDPAIPPMFADIPMTSAATAYEGAAVTDDGGNGLVDGALVTNETFLGFVEHGKVNPTGGDYRVRIRQQGIVKDLPVTGLDANTDLGVAVYATDNGTFTLTASGALQIGKVQAYKGKSGYGDVFFQGTVARSV